MSSLEVVFPDEIKFSTNINCKDSAEVWVQTIRKLLHIFGVERIRQADRDTKLHENVKERFVSHIPNFRDTAYRKRGYTQYVENGFIYYIVDDYNAETKKRLLLGLSEYLGISLEITIRNY